MSYFSCITTVFYSAIFAYTTARIWYVGLSSPEDSLKKIALGILVFYFLLSAGMKRLELEEDGIVFFYFLRPFARRYRYRYEDVRRVYHECTYGAGAFPFFIITTNRNHPFLFFRRKYLFFINQNERHAKSIIKVFREKGVKIVLKGPKSTRKYLNEDD